MQAADAAMASRRTPRTRLGRFVRWLRINRRLREAHPIRDAWRLSK